MRIALIFSAKCSTYLPDAGFDVAGLYETRGLTGSESGIFNVAKGLSELGHEVHVFCKTHAPKLNCKNLAGASVFPQDYPMGDDYDGFVSWNDPDHLPAARTRGIKICSQQLNDFTISESPYDRRTDVYAFPSTSHLEYMVKRCRLRRSKCVVVPNSTNVEFFEPSTKKEPGSVVYTSSPDRGLHHLLDIFPLVREQVKFAKLKIFYRFWPWYKAAMDSPDLIGQRARYIAERFRQLGTNGENGVTLVGPVDNKTLAKELSKSAVLAYPCVPVRYTEGFSIAVLDACAAGCLPVLSDVDALPSIYGDHAVILEGSPKKNIDDWVNVMAEALTDEPVRSVLAKGCVDFAQQFSRREVSKTWEKLISGGKL
jgi:glycosyltransferase involved in cell wall biosynthesis